VLIGKHLVIFGIGLFAERKTFFYRFQFVFEELYIRAPVERGDVFFDALVEGDFRLGPMEPFEIRFVESRRKDEAVIDRDQIEFDFPPRISGFFD